VTHDRVGLIGAWPTVVQIIQRDIDPRKQELPQEDEREGQHHAYTQCEDGSFSRGTCARWWTTSGMRLIVRLASCRTRGLDDDEGQGLGEESCMLEKQQRATLVLEASPEPRDE
jgi:hypothetical protein